MSVLQIARDEAAEYWRREGLDRLLAAAGNADSAAISPHIDDLIRLHRLVRSRMSQTVLEFGVGYSTLVLADALLKNERAFEALPNAPKLRNANAFKLFSVDANRHWIEVAQSRIPPHLSGRVSIAHSRVLAGTFNGRLCHYYEAVPNVVADFIYLDGPDPRDIEGGVNGMDFSIGERTVMAADLLLMEPSLLPGTMILVDGRVNNARFLQRNFQRPFRVEYDTAGDVTSFELDEPPLGRHNIDLAQILAQQSPVKMAG